MSVLGTLIDRIQRSGPVTFRDFMELALYDDRAGFYGAGRVRFGTRGDFVTTSGVHALFGALLANWIVQRWHELGAPSELTIVELGPGSGRLACDILDALDAKPEGITAQVTYLLVERSAALRERQEAMLLRHAGRVMWASLDVLPLGGITGVVIANELFDALPAHRVCAERGKVKEQWVETRGSGLGTFWSEPSTPELQAYVEHYAPDLVAGDHQAEIEVCLDAPPLLARAAASLDRGCLLTIDYGGEAKELYSADRPRGTIRAFEGRQLFEGVLAEPGQRDITASVNFTALVDAGRARGLVADPLVSQLRFLLSLGLAEGVGALVGSGDSRAALESRLAAKSLLVAGGIGDAMKVLVQRTSIPRRPLEPHRALP